MIGVVTPPADPKAAVSGSTHAERHGPEMFEPCFPTHDAWCLVQKQALLHDQSKQKGKADAPPLNGASGPGSDGSEAEEGGSSRDNHHY